MCTTDTPRAEAAGVMWLGSVAIDIPPRAAGHTVTGTCSSFLTSFFSEPLTILASGPHMHQLGTRFVSEIRRGGDSGPAEMLDVVDPWDFNSQISYWHDGTMIQPGEGTGGGILKQPQPGAPSVWLSYAQVDDIKASTAKARSLGARIMKDVTEVPGAGWLSIITDPTRATLGLWQPMQR